MCIYEYIHIYVYVYIYIYVYIYVYIYPLHRKISQNPNPSKNYAKGFIHLTTISKSRSLATAW